MGVDGGKGGSGLAGGRLATKRGILVAGGGAILGVDLVTKWLVQENFYPGGSVEVLGDLIRLTYILNPGAAFGIHVGEYSRIVFMTLSALAVVVLTGLFWSTPSTERLRLHAIALVVGGALGNLVDRIRSPMGVVDFLDVGLGSLRWPVFNVADIGVTMGAVLLALSLWQEEAESARRPAAGEVGEGPRASEPGE